MLNSPYVSPLCKIAALKQGVFVVCDLRPRVISTVMDANVNLSWAVVSTVFQMMLVEFCYPLRCGKHDLVAISYLAVLNPGKLIHRSYQSYFVYKLSLQAKHSINYYTLWYNFFSNVDHGCPWFIFNDRLFSIFILFCGHQFM